MIQQIGKYKIEGKLGEGSIASVYKAFDSDRNQNVAIKVMAEDIKWNYELKQRFISETLASAGLRHANIATIYDIGEEGNSVYIVMEYLQGDNLKRIIREKISIPLEKKLALMIQVADGLSYAHSAGFIHRNIKPGNIFVTTNGVAKIMDFGIPVIPASSLPRSVDQLELSIYMSPEQIRSERIDARSDIFSSGIVFYELLAYVHPFWSNSLEQLRENLLKKKELQFAEELLGNPRGLLPILKTCLEKEPNKRYDGMSDVATASRSLVDAMGAASQQMIKEISAFLPQLHTESQKPNASGNLIQLYYEAQDLISRGQSPSYHALFHFRASLAEEPALRKDTTPQPSSMQSGEEYPSRLANAHIQETPAGTALPGGMEMKQDSSPSSFHPNAQTRETESQSHTFAQANISPSTDVQEKLSGVITMLAEERLDEAMDRLLAIMMDLGPIQPVVQMIAETRRRIDQRNRKLIAQSFASAREAMASRNLLKAVEDLNGILELEPNNGEAFELRRMAFADIEAEKEQQAPKEEKQEKPPAPPIETPFRSPADAIPTIPKISDSLKKTALPGKDKLGKQEIDNNIAEAEQAFQSGNLTKCEIHLRCAMVINPDDSRVKELQSRISQIRENKMKERVTPLLQQGQEALAAGDIERAAGFAREVLGLDLRNVDAQKLIADVEKVKADRQKEKIESLLFNSREALYKGEFESATNLANQIIAIDAGYQETKSLMKEIDRARRKHEKELRKQQKDSEKAAAVVQSVETEEVENPIEQQTVAAPIKQKNNHRGLIGLGIGLIVCIVLAAGIFLTIQRRNEARQAEARKASEIAFQINSAKSYLEQDQYEQVIEVVRKILALSPNNNQANEILSEMKVRQKKHSVEAHLLRAQLLREQGQYEESLNAVQKALDIDPAYVPAIEARIQIQAERDAGLSTLPVKQVKEDNNILLVKAESLLAACKLAESKTELDKIKSIQDKEFQKRLSKARSLFNACKLDEVKVLIRRAGNSNAPELEMIKKQLAAKTLLYSAVSKKMNEWSQTLGSQNELAELSRQTESLFEQGDYDNCSSALVRVLELSPQHRRALELRDLVNRARDSRKFYENAMASKQYDIALKAVDRLEQINPLDPGIAGLRQQAEAKLKSAKATLTIFRTGEPAQLLLDDKQTGNDGEVEKNVVSVGRHKLVISSNNGQEKTVPLEFVDGQDAVYLYNADTLEFRPMKDSDRETIEARKQREKVIVYTVTHQHGMLRGNCVGKLSISAMRVEYVPSQGSHSFAHALATLDLNITEDKLQFVETSGNKEWVSFKTGNPDRARKIKELWDNLKHAIR
jgi:serine/threonine protein kinase